MADSKDTISSIISRYNLTGSNDLDNAPILSPPRAMTPPPAIEKRRIYMSANLENSNRSDRSNTPLDPNALTRALMRESEELPRSREVTPGGSPQRKRQRVYGDR
jgi:cell division cycle 20-like protein 1 (cofactor of APC complex)